eukprot:XP_001705804.1 Hypothetical protein GL50803_113281 [Giardia lamblia ATCC 50803]
MNGRLSSAQAHGPMDWGRGTRGARKRKHGGRKPGLGPDDRPALGRVVGRGAGDLRAQRVVPLALRGRAGRRRGEAGAPPLPPQRRLPFQAGPQAVRRPGECAVSLSDLRAESTQNASKQLPPPLTHCIQVLHLVLASLNLRGVTVFEHTVYDRLDGSVDCSPYLHTFEGFVRALVHPLALLLSKLIQADAGPHNNTFNNAIARCVACCRPVALLRQALLLLLGPLGDHKQARKCRSIRRMALEEQGSAGSCAIKTVKRLPPPRFRGYVNPTSSSVAALLRFFEGSFRPKDAPFSSGNVSPTPTRASQTR